MDDDGTWQYRVLYFPSMIDVLVQIMSVLYPSKGSSCHQSTPALVSCIRHVTYSSLRVHLLSSNKAFNIAENMQEYALSVSHCDGLRPFRPSLCGPVELCLAPTGSCFWTRRRQAPIIISRLISNSATSCQSTNHHRHVCGN